MSELKTKVFESDKAKNIADDLWTEVEKLQQRIEKLEKVAKAAKELDSRYYRHPEDGTPYDESAENFIRALDELKMFECDRVIISAEQCEKLRECINEIQTTQYQYKD